MARHRLGRVVTAALAVFLWRVLGSGSVGQRALLGALFAATAIVSLAFFPLGRLPALARRRRR